MEFLLAKYRFVDILIVVVWMRSGRIIYPRKDTDRWSYPQIGFNVGLSYAFVGSLSSLSNLSRVQENAIRLR